MPPPMLTVVLKSLVLAELVGSCGRSAAAAQPRRLGTGCYDVFSHRCNCLISEAECHRLNRTWTDRCRTCDAADNVHNPQCPKENSWGCFSSASHSCECEVSESVCEGQLAQGKYWTRECWSCCHHSEWGCFVPGNGPESGCQCDVFEGACQLSFPDATWSHLCHECSDEGRVGAQERDGTNSDTLVIVVVVLSVVLVIALVAAVAATWYLRGQGKLSRGRGGDATPGSGDIVVGNPVGNPAGSAGDASAKSGTAADTC
mmetsp:Transcript_87723/g.248534  ORF Transcript_87723/g.248534 Transcript_87723/m.248534 type:complete len:259 (-) Transcript_87723:61-837(-)